LNLNVRKDLTKKILIGVIIGAIAGLSVTAVLKFRREEELFSEEDLSDDNDLLDDASKYLNLAKSKAELLVHEAERKSNSILEQAGKILSSAKEKTSSIYFEPGESVREQINKIKAEIDKSIEDFRKQLGKY
jgi:gas vesicle protein